MSTMDLYNLLRLTIHFLSDLAVPCFFFSGYLFFINMKQWDLEKFKHKLSRRLHSLIIPYLIWNVIPVLKALVKSAFQLNESILTSWYNVMDSKGWLHIFWDSHERLGQTGAPEDMPLWFLRDLIILSFILTPIIFYVAKRKAGFLLFAVFFILGMLKIPEVAGFSYSAIFWFSTGAYISIQNFPIIRYVSRYHYLYLSIFIGCFVASIVFRGSHLSTSWFHSLSILTGVPIVLLSSIHLGEKLSQILSKLSRATFFVFAAHTILILDYCRSLVKIATGDNLFLCYLIPPVLAVLVCTAIYFALNKISPKLCSIINGR